MEQQLPTNQGYDGIDFGLIAQQQQAHEQTIRWQIEPAQVLKEIEEQLRGLEYVEGKGVIQFRKPLLNKTGIGGLMILLRSHLNHNNALSVLKREEVLNIAKGCATVVNDQLYINRHHWDVRPEDWMLINNIVEDQIFAFFTRAIEGGERDSIRGVQRFSETAVPSRRSWNPFKKDQAGDMYGAY